MAARDYAPMPSEPSRSAARAAPLAASAKLQISLLGDFELSFQGTRLLLPNRKARALAGYLALAPSFSESRGRLVGLLWSETDEARARATLRQVLKDLRTVFDTCGFRGFRTTRTDVGFERGAIDVDVTRIVDSVAAGQPMPRLLDTLRISETLMAGFEDLDPSLRTWLLVSRESLRGRLVRDLEDQIAAAAEDGRDLRRLAQALLQIDPTHEAACQALIRSLADDGDNAGALAAYKRLWDLLAEEYDTEPSEQTQGLIAAIKTGDYRPSAPVRSAPSAVSEPRPAAHRTVSRPKLVLVLGAFEMDGVDPARRHIALGLRYELISRLVRFREWSLIDAMTASGPATGMPTAQYRLLGRIFEAPSALNLIMTLEASETGHIVWSERFELTLSRFFETQQLILHRIAASLNIHLSIERMSRIASAPDIDLDVYDRWLRSQMLILQFRGPDHARAEQVLTSIAAEAPSYAPALSGLAQICNARHIVLAGTYRTIESQQRALSFAKTAVALDPLDSRSQLSLAWAYAMNSDFDLAVSTFRQACELNEDDPWTMTSAALGLAYADHLDEARERAELALARSPCPAPLHWCYQSTIRFLARDYAGALAVGEHVGDAIRYFRGWRAAMLAHVGRTTDARAEAARFGEVIRGTWYGPPSPSDDMIVSWLLSCFPVRNRDALDPLAHGLHTALSLRR